MTTKKTNSINNDTYEFRLLDFNIFNKPIIETVNSDSENEEPQKYKPKKFEFAIQMFGLNEKRETASIIVTGFKPFFYIKVDNFWKEKDKVNFNNFIKEKIGLKNTTNDFFAECVFVDKKKLYGFDGGRTHKFLYYSFDNQQSYNKVKNLWYYNQKISQTNKNKELETDYTEFANENVDEENEKTERKIKKGGVLFEKTKTFLYEGNIPPLLRFFHIQKISPSGWVSLPKSKTTILNGCNNDNDNDNDEVEIDTEADADTDEEAFNIKTRCKYELSIDYQHIIPLNEKEARVPYKICSFDIEASSSHGDFPVPIKTYKKLAQNIVEYYCSNFIDKEQEKIIATTTANEIFTRLIMSAFAYDKVEGIDLIYTKRKVSKKDLQKMIDTILKKEITNTKKINFSNNDDIDGIVSVCGDGGGNYQATTIENMFEKMRAKEKENADYEEANCYGYNDDDNYEECNNDDEKLEINEEIAISTSTKTIITLLLNKNIPRDYKINIVNKLFMSILPKVEGDKVTFIGSTFMNYGEKTPYLNKCIALNTCDKSPTGDIDIESYSTEKEVLCAWTKLIQEEDPDIIIGYNIFGFDYSFMFYRAMECSCLDEFLKLSRNKDEICGKITSGKRGDEYKLEELTITIASGTHEFKYIKMNGRLQIDLYSYFRRAENLSSYKLDFVSGYFIGDYIKNIEYEQDEETGETYTILHTTNFTGLVEDSYIHIEMIDYTTEYYNLDGCEKFLINNIEQEDGYFVIKGKLEPQQNKNKKLRWCLAKDDVSPKEIFEKTNGTSADRFIIAKYCIQDCNLVHYLLNKVDIITEIIEMANICSVPISFILLRGQGIKLTSCVSRECRENNILMPTINKGSDTDSYEGAIVLDPKCDLYLDKPIPVGDFSSLYPSSQISENLSPDSEVWCKEYDLDGKIINETGEKDEMGNFIYDNLEGYEYVDIRFDSYRYERKTPKAAAKKVICGYKVCRFAQFPNNDKAIMPKILEKFLKARKDTKKLAARQTDEFMRNVYDKRQLAYKITANSLYGQCGAKTSNFYAQNVAACTTATGRKLLTYAKKIVEECYKDCVCNTSNGVRVRTRAEYVYGDTDSVFFTFNLETLEGEKITGKQALGLSIEIAQQATALVSKFLKKPHDFAYEKTFMPFCLLSKKRYVGILYETDVNKGKQKSMGLVLKRRDNAPVVKKIYGGIIDILMKEQNIMSCIQFLDDWLKRIVEKRCNMDDLVITKSLNSFYKNPNQIAHKVLADRMTQRDPGNKPSSGERIPFVYIQVEGGNRKGILQGDRIETPTYIKENNIDIDYSFYITNQIMKPVQQIFSLILVEIWKQQKKFGAIQAYNKTVKDLEKTIDDADKLEKKIEKLRNDEVKKLLFDKYLNIANNSTSSSSLKSNSKLGNTKGLQKITKFFI